MEIELWWHFRNETHIHGTHCQCKVTPGVAFDIKTNGSRYQYHYTLDLLPKKVLTWIEAKIYLPSPSCRSPYSIFTHAVLDPSSTNPRRHVTIMQFFTRQPSRSPRPLSQLFSKKSEGILYIWAVYIHDLLVIARYFASFTLNQGLVMKFASLFFFFFVWCLGFCI